jgi:hypothetical protein
MVDTIFGTMTRIKGMHDKNPLFVTLPGNLYRHSISSLFENGSIKLRYRGIFELERNNRLAGQFR